MYQLIDLRALVGEIGGDEMVIDVKMYNNVSGYIHTHSGSRRASALS
jgi:hypothetical protein